MFSTARWYPCTLPARSAVTFCDDPRLLHLGRHVHPLIISLSRYVYTALSFCLGLIVTLCTWCYITSRAASFELHCLFGHLPYWITCFCPRSLTGQRAKMPAKAAVVPCPEILCDLTTPPPTPPKKKCQAGINVYYFYGLWYDSAGDRTHELPVSG